MNVDIITAAVITAIAPQLEERDRLLEAGEGLYNMLGSYEWHGDDGEGHQECFECQSPWRIHNHRPGCDFVTKRAAWRKAAGEVPPPPPPP